MTTEECSTMSMISIEDPSERIVSIINSFLIKNMNLKFSYEGEECLIVLKDKKEIVGVGYVFNKELKYLCTDERYRNIGIGRKIVSYLLRKYEALLIRVPIGIVWEDGNPYPASEPLGFYRKNFCVDGPFELDKFIISLLE